jgi:hypothetical protein
VLVKDFLLNDLGDIYKNILKGQEKELSIAYNSAEKRVAKLYSQFKLSFVKPS